MSDYIPDHILADVLVRLPFKSLVRFMCVSKSWRDLIDSKYITDKHSTKSRMIQSYPHPDSMIIALVNEQLYAFDFVVKKGEGLCKANARQLMSPVTKFPDLRIVGSCNGILCLATEKWDPWEQNLVLWNPFTCRYFELPPPPDDFSRDVHPTSEAFGYDHINDDHKLIRWFTNSNNMYSNERISPRRYELCVYSLKQNSWKAIRNGIPFELSKYYFLSYDCICTMANGSAHWIDYLENNFIVVFDLGTCEFRKVSCSLPPKDRGDREMSCLNGCLSLACYPDRHRRGQFNEPRVADIWIMEEYGVETSWKKLASIELVRGGEFKWPMPVAMSQKGRNLLLKCLSQKLVIYDIGRKSFCKVAVKGETDWYNNVCDCEEGYCYRSKCYYRATYCVCVGSLFNPASYS